MNIYNSRYQHIGMKNDKRIFDLLWKNRASVVTERTISGSQTFDNQVINEVNEVQLPCNEMLNSLQTGRLLKEFLLFMWRKHVSQSLV